MSNNGKKVFSIAHRGFSAEYPENTLLAFSKAIEANADMIEFDVHLSKDDIPVVIHDNNLERTSNGSGFVNDLTYAQLQKFIYNNGMKNCGTNTIPTLQQVLDIARNKVMCNIELKNLPYHYSGLENIVIGHVKKNKMEDQVIVSSFDHFSLKEVKKDSSIKIGMLYDAVWTTFQQELLELQPYSIHPCLDTFNLQQAQWASENGFKVFVWVATTLYDITFLMNSGVVDGIMVNNPYLVSSY